MNRRKFSAVVAASSAVVLWAVASTSAQVSYTGGNYTQNFDTLPQGVSTGTNALLLGTFVATGATTANLDTGSPFNASGLTGWQIFHNGNIPVFASGGAPTNSGAYSFGTDSTSDRALGGIGGNASYGTSGSGRISFGVRLVNNTGGTLNAFTLNYTGEQWRNGGVTAVQNLAFSYIIGDSATAVVSHDNSTNAVTFAGLNFASPIATTTAGALNGNLAANRAAISATVTGITWNAGDTIALRWTDLNDAGNDHGLGIDDLSFNAFVATPNTLLWTGATNGNWNTTTANFTSNAASATFASNDITTFNDSATAVNVTVAATGITAGQATFANNTKNFTLSGGILSIGTGGLVKSGTGTLTLANTVNATVLASAGTLVTTGTGAVTGTLILNGATLSTQNSPTFPTVSVSPTGGIVQVAAGQTSTFTALTTSATAFDGSTVGTIAKTGPGVLRIGNVPNGLIRFGLSAGVLNFAQTAGTTGFYIDPAWSNAASGDLLISGNNRYNLLADGNPLNGNTIGATGSTGKIIFAGTGAASGNSSLPNLTASSSGGSSQTYDINLSIEINGTDADRRYSIGGGSFAGSPNTLVLERPISGVGTIVFGGQSTSALPVGGSTVSQTFHTGLAGITVLNSTSSYTGRTILGHSSGGTLRIGVDNALPVNTAFQFGDDNQPATLSIGALDLNGRSLQIGSLTYAPPESGAFIDGIRNSAGTAATLRINGAQNGAYSGPIDGNINIIKAGASTQILSGSVSSNSTGNTDVLGGVLQVGDGGNTGALGGGTISVAAPATLVLNRNDAVTLPNNFAGTGSVTHSGTGTTTLTGGYNNTGTLTVSAGTLVLPPNASSSAYSTIAAPAKIVTAANITLPVSANPLRPGVVVAGTIEITSSTGFFDITNNDIITDSSSLTAYLLPAAANWYASTTPAGLGSSLAGKIYTTVVLFSNNDNGSPFYSTYDGVALTASNTIVKYSYVGDTNVDGVLDGIDAANILESLSTGIYLSSADTNFDGVINATDWANFQFALTYVTTPPLSNGQGGGNSGGAIPEPSALGLLLAAMPLVSRRRR